MRTKYTYIVMFVIGKMKLVIFSMFLDAPPPLDLKMPFLYVVNVYSYMSLSKGHLDCQDGDTPANPLKCSCLFEAIRR